MTKNPPGPTGSKELTINELWHPPNAPRGWVGLELIAVFKFIKTGGLILAGLGALGLLNAGREDAAGEWLEQLSLSQGHRLAASLASRAVELLDNATPRQLVVAALGSFLYAAIFLVEGIGLWRCKRWAEYLTVGVTASLLPLELFAIATHATPFRVAAVMLNVLVVAYLVWQLKTTAGPRSGRLPSEAPAK